MKRLVLAPAERTDIVVDFSLARCQAVVLMSDHLQLMQFRVGSDHVVDDSQIPMALRPVERIDVTKAVRTRELTLNEFDSDNVAEPQALGRARDRNRETGFH
jgi:spore coat protein A